MNGNHQNILVSILTQICWYVCTIFFGFNHIILLQYFLFNFYLPKLDGRPCIKSDCQLLELHLGSKFAAAQIGSGGGYAEISAAGGGSSGRSDLDVFNGWKNSPGHNEIMLTKDGEYPVFGCANFPPGEFAHCICFSLDKKLPGGSFFIRDCA